MSKLVVVESPTKARTIRGFLPAGYEVLDSRGHIRDLPNSAQEVPAAVKRLKWSTLGVNVEQDFEPLYVVPKDKSDTVRALKRALKEADELIIATDEDREGESIGWHIFDVLQPKVPVKRIVFHEITESAILEALDHPGALNENLVNAQKARRILDRLVGYTLSPLLWRKVAPRLSAGRVQSVAMRLLVERERDRRGFVKGHYWDMVARLFTAERAGFSARLYSVNEQRVAAGKDFDKDTGQLKKGVKALVLDKEAAENIAARLPHMSWQVAALAERTSKRRPPPPYTTSTMQIEANRRLGLSAEQTMRVAQNLYENGHITYMRTDSVNLSSQAVAAVRRRVQAMYGQDAVPDKPRVYRTATRNAQEAHEAIRPAGDGMQTAEQKQLQGRERSLYHLIWKRTMATQMRDALLKTVTARIAVTRPAGNGSTPVASHDQVVEQAEFRARGTEVLFPGFLALNGPAPAADAAGDSEEPREGPLPPMSEGETLDLQGVELEGHETRPPARFTEAALVKALTDNGIGRPSTYASIIETIQAREYVFKARQELIPSFTAFAVVSLLEQAFDYLVDYDFTARMEDDLDQIALGKEEWIGYVRDFYLGENGLEVQVSEQEARIDPSLFRTLELPDFEYPVRIGRYGPFLEKDSPESSEQPRRVSLPRDLPPADLTMSLAEELFSAKDEEPRNLGMDQEGDYEIHVIKGPYGHYIQHMRPTVKGQKPKRAPIPNGTQPEQLTLDQARFLLSLPVVLGAHPDDQKDVTAHIGRYGSYISHSGNNVTLPAEDSIYDLTLERAVAVLGTPKSSRGTAAAVVRDLGPHPKEQVDILILDGRYGPYIRYGKLNVSLPKDREPAALTVEEAVALIEKKRQNPTRRRRRRRK